MRAGSGLGMGCFGAGRGTGRPASRARWVRTRQRPPQDFEQQRVVLPRLKSRLRMGRTHCGHQTTSGYLRRCSMVWAAWLRTRRFAA